jgi:tRNA pseudouridine13 synthase
MTIRRRPRDFLVREILGEPFHAGLCPAAGAAAPHAVYVLTKSSLTTPDALRDLGRALRASRADVVAAGLKDRHAETAQHVSVRAGDARAAARMPAVLHGRSWRAERIGWSPAPIAPPAIAGNRFEIAVRGLTERASGEMERRAALLLDPAPAAAPRLLAINYFGAQRFGSARHGRGFAARALVAGDFERALRLLVATPARQDAGRTKIFVRAAAAGWGRWDDLARALPRCPERRAIEVLATGGDFRAAFAALPALVQRMSVEAYQSHLWNGAARTMVKERFAGAALKAADEFGRMLFPPAELLPGEWRAMSVPLLGPRTALEGEWGAAAARVLAVDGIGAADLRIPGLRRPFFAEAPRALVACAERFEMSSPEADDLAADRRMRTLRFDLPRGAYATVVLRALGQ